MTAALHNDVARCDGVGSDAEGWRDGCERCLRRTAPRPADVRMIAPPPIIAFECEYLIEANAERQSRREATYSERSCSPGGPTC